MSKIILLFLFSCIQLSVFAQKNTFYKQFSGKIQDKAVRVVLIKAPSKENDFNLRGNYYYDRIGKTIVLNNGTIDGTGNFYLEEGFYKSDNFNGEQAIFVKTGAFLGTYYEDKALIEGTYTNLSSKQSSPFVLQESYSNGSAAADIVFNDLNYEGTSIRFHYPKLQNHSAAIKINQFIKEKLLGNMPEKINQFILKVRENLEVGGMIDGFESSNIAYILYNENHLFALKYQTAVNMGEPHGTYTSNFYNFNLKNGELLNLEDVLNKGFEAELTKIAEQSLRQSYGVKPEQSLSEFGFTLPQGKFYLSKNFYLNKDGIGFFYNHYEIAPYAVGTQDIFIPFSKIKNWIRKDSVIGKFVN